MVFMARIELNGVVTPIRGMCLVMRYLGRFRTIFDITGIFPHEVNFVLRIKVWKQLVSQTAGYLKPLVLIRPRGFVERDTQNTVDDMNGID